MSSSFSAVKLLPLLGNPSSRKGVVIVTNATILRNCCTKSRLFSTAAAAGGSSYHWAHFPMGPPDPIVGLNEAFAKDVSQRC